MAKNCADSLIALFDANWPKERNLCKNMAFCEECRSDVEYDVKTLSMTGKIKGVEYHYIGQEARCVHCHSLVYAPDIVDLNLKALYDVFRKENGIISLEKIRAIPKRYAIGKRPLSLV